MTAMPHKMDAYDNNGNTTDRQIRVLDNILTFFGITDVTYKTPITTVLIKKNKARLLKNLILLNRPPPNLVKYYCNFKFALSPGATW